MKNNIVIRLEEKNEYRKVENLVRDSFWNVYRPDAWSIMHWRKLQSLAVERCALKEILIFMERAVLSRQTSMVSDIMDCRRGKMHHSFCVRN